MGLVTVPYSISRSPSEKAWEHLSVLDFNAKGNTKTSQGTIASGSPTLHLISTSFTITAASNTSPIILTFSANTYLQSGMTIVVSSVTGNTAANGTWVVKITEANQAILWGKLNGANDWIPGSQGNGAYISGGSATNVLAPFTAQDKGKTIYVIGAGAAGAVLQTTISTVVSPSQCTLATNASTTVSGLASTNLSGYNVVWGTDDSDAFQNAFDAIDILRNSDREVGSYCLEIPKGVYLISQSLFAQFNRLRVKGAGSMITRLVLAPGTTLANPQNLPTAAYATGLLSSGAGYELVKYGILNSYRNSNFFSWEISGITLDGGDWNNSTNNCGICLYGAQQPGFLQDVFTTNMGGHACYFGYGDASLSNPECDFLTIRNCEFLWSGLSAFQATHNFVVEFISSNAEHVQSGAGFYSCGRFIGCHVEYSQYGFRPEVSNAPITLGPVSTLIGCTGYANPANANSKDPSAIAFVYAPLFGAKLICCSEVDYTAYAILQTITYQDDSTYHQATGSINFTNAWDIKRNCIVGDFQKVFGNIPDIPIYIKQTGNCLMRFVLAEAAIGTVNTSGTAVTWESGDQFGSLTSTDFITIGATTYAISSVNSDTSITLGSSAGTQTGASFQAGGYVTFSPQLELFASAYSQTNVLVLDMTAGGQVTGAFVIPFGGNLSYLFSSTGFHSQNPIYLDNSSLGSSVMIQAGSGNPNGSIIAEQGSIWIDVVNAVWYLKTGGTSDTGWKTITHS